MSAHTDEDAFVSADPTYRRMAADSATKAKRRAALPAGSTRARVTTANANWARAAEARDRRERDLRAEYRKANQS